MDDLRRLQEFYALTQHVGRKVREAMSGGLTLDQTYRLHRALELHADNAKSLLAGLEDANAAADLVDAARNLDVTANELASSAAQLVLDKLSGQSST